MNRTKKRSFIEWIESQLQEQIPASVLYSKCIVTLASFQNITLVLAWLIVISSFFLLAKTLGSLEGRDIFLKLLPAFALAYSPTSLEYLTRKLEKKISWYIHILRHQTLQEAPFQSKS